MTEAEIRKKSEYHGHSHVGGDDPCEIDKQKERKAKSKKMMNHMTKSLILNYEQCQFMAFL